MTELLIKLLIKEEGMVLSEYKDHLGYSTIGVGRLIDSRKGGGISEGEARYLLFNDIQRVERQLDREIPWWTSLDYVRQLILASMAFQMGVPGLLKFKRTLAATKDGRYADAAAAMRGSLWYTQTPERAERAATAMESGILSDLEV